MSSHLFASMVSFPLLFFWCVYVCVVVGVRVCMCACVCACVYVCVCLQMCITPQHMICVCPEACDRDKLHGIDLAVSMYANGCLCVVVDVCVCRKCLCVVNVCVS